MPKAIIIGSGPNGLAAALVLLSFGVSVTLFEAASYPGGGMHSAELTLPGLTHDVCSGFHPFGPASLIMRRFGLHEHGVRWAWPDIQYAHPLDGGDGACSLRSLEATAKELGPDGSRWQRLFGPLSDDLYSLFSDDYDQLKLKRKLEVLARFGARSFAPSTATGKYFREPAVRALWSGLAAHGFVSPNALWSSAIGAVLGAAAHTFGWPVAAGGSETIGRTMVEIVRSQGGTVVTGHRVSDIRELGQSDVLLLDTSPSVAVEIAGAVLPKRTQQSFRKFRYGPGVYQLSLAVEEGIPWSYVPARRSGVVHLCGGEHEVIQAERQVNQGNLPQRPFVLVGQQYLADPGRASEGIVPIDCYAHVPNGYNGNATEAVLSQIERFAPRVRSRIVKIAVRRPRDIEGDNLNFSGGDILTGAKTARQLMFGAHFSLSPYSTGAPGVFLCSAATFPGPGAHGMAGYWAARSAARYLGL